MRVNSTTVGTFLTLAVFLLSPALSFGGPVALFEQAHDQRFVIEGTGELDLGTLAGVFEDAGFEVRSTTEPITSEALQGVTALISSGSFKPFSTAEIEAVSKFIEGGGSFSMMLHIPMTYQGLLDSLGVVASSGVVNDDENPIDGKTQNFKIVNFSKHPLIDGLDSFNVYGGWALLGRDMDVRTVAYTSKKGWIDMNRDRVRDPRGEPLHAFNLVVAAEKGEGRFVVFGDDAIFQNQFIEGGNRALAQNLAKWMMGGR